MQAVAFQNTASNEIVIAYEGTNFSNVKTPSYIIEQLEADADIAHGKIPAADADAFNFVQAVKFLASSNPVYTTGHSLGGEEAEYVQSQLSFVSGGASFGAPGVPNLSGAGANANFISYQDAGDLIGGYVPPGSGHPGLVIPVGNPLDASAERFLILNDTTGAGTAAAIAIGYGDHQLSHYAQDLGVTLAQSPDPAAGELDGLEYWSSFGIAPFGGVGAPSPGSTPIDQNGTVSVGSNSFTEAGQAEFLSLTGGESDEILIASGQSVDATSAGVTVLEDAAGGNAISTGTSANVTLIGEGNDSTLTGNVAQDAIFV